MGLETDLGQLLAEKDQWKKGEFVGRAATPGPEPLPEPQPDHAGVKTSSIYSFCVLVFPLVPLENICLSLAL